MFNIIAKIFWINVSSWKTEKYIPEIYNRIVIIVEILYNPLNLVSYSTSKGATFQ